ncbi:helix-turn-helix transcriptional regulator [Massilia sp. PAMC28688]|uniref:winged helix-turn-helix transcriptional regulator n=1 Tax=Massilia sp. PAMC28688 TaxID=2861283 RepID=UPI001C62D290|nr:helix-turn-helix domain-containing protein [Massilia sp. PAMC28688]QYF94922.1 helix-turn-helix transcriptional regulator [Massilia sp. PAMC28688]
MDLSCIEPCPLARAAQLLCERWTLLLVRELLCGGKRFNALHRGVPAMSTSLLAQRLRHLESAGIVRRSVSGKVWEYALTEAGDALGSVIFELERWAACWDASGDQAPGRQQGLLPRQWPVHRAGNLL